MRAVIFANGDLPDIQAAKQAIHAEDLIIAANGGARHCLAMELSPAVVIGDFDSLTKQEQSTLEEQGSEFIRHLANKDKTDLELALLHAKTLNVTEALVLAGLGSNWDQSLANLLLPSHPQLKDMKITFLQGNQRLSLIHDQMRIQGNPGDIVSLIPIGGDAHGVKTFNLEYPLSDETLYFGATRGVSNVLIENEASISVQEGILLCVFISQ